MTSNSVSTIQAHEPDGRRSDFIRIVFDNRDPMEIPISAWVEFGLKDGLVLDESMLSSLEETATLANWQSQALNYLSHKPRTKVEVIRYLGRKGASEEAAERVAAALQQMGYLSDAKYAQMFVQSYQGRASRREIAWRLNQRGIEEGALERTLKDPEVYEGELEAAIALARKAVRTGKQSDAAALRQRLWSRLERKGFSRDSIRAATNQVMSELESIAQRDFLDND